MFRQANGDGWSSGWLRDGVSYVEIEGRGVREKVNSTNKRERERHDVMCRDSEYG